MPEADFVSPAWDAPLDADAVIARVPPGATMKGMFPQALATRARQGHIPLSQARARYQDFDSYPLAEHCRILVEVARGVWPEQTLRRGLRRLGRGAPRVLLETAMGPSTFGPNARVEEVVLGVADAYAQITEPARIRVLEAGPGRARIALRDVYFFLDSHHVGIYEGTLRHAKAREPRVRVHALSETDADLLCEWSV